MRTALLSAALIAICASPLTFSQNNGGDAMPAAAAASQTTLDAAVAGSWRDAANAARDGARNPKQTLEFFGLAPDMTVIEVSPGAGWWTEILAPWLGAQGNYVAAIPDASKAASERARTYFTGANAEFRERLAASPAQYAGATVREVDMAAPVYGPAGSADAVLTFRNIHGWMRNDQAEMQMKAFFEVLKPGGVLGLEQHRADADVPKDQINGYVSEAQVIALAEGAGFELAARSEINANPKDTKDHPNGVWTLPPNLNVPEGEDKAKYEAIGESDRMTLRFVKPQA